MVLYGMILVKGGVFPTENRAKMNICLVWVGMGEVF
jgi:hypothetical protein